MARHTDPHSSSDGRPSSFKLPKTSIPEPVLPGVKMWETSDGWTVARVHYTADPAVDDEWVADRVIGYRGGLQGRDWQRELEIDFSSWAGDPVYPLFSSECVQATQYDPELELWRGWDFGFRHPAVVFVQYDPKQDQLRWLHELYPTLDSESVPGINTQSLIGLVKNETSRLFHEVTNGDAPVRDFVDPAGMQHKETSDFSSIEHMQQHGLMPEWVSLGRKNRINYARHWVEGGPDRFRVNPHCTLSVTALGKAYRYPESNKGGMDRDMPDLSKKVQSEPYVHLMDAFEYVVANVLQLDDIADPSAWSRDETEQTRIGDLAEMYLRASNMPPDRLARSGYADEGYDDYESRLSDLIGEDDLSDAWSQ